MTVSISERIHAAVAQHRKVWKHDRSKTVGASEIGQCARKTYFSKTDAPRDPGYVDGWGARVRGQVIEDCFWVPALRASLQEDEYLLFSGKDQQTFTSGYLSATTDGLLVLADGTCINLDCKSIDPRADISKEKTAHHFQVQAQMGLIREITNFQPDISVLTYIDASFWDKIAEFVIPFSERIYAQARVRATQIMTAREATALPPEGKMAGGSECEYCPWASHCADVTAAGVPFAPASFLGHNAAEHLKALVDAAHHASVHKELGAQQYAAATEAIKSFLRENNCNGYKGDGWSVTYSVVKGRVTLDVDALAASGIDLEPFKKEGKPSERLTVR